MLGVSACGWVLGVVGAEYAAGGVGVLRVMVVASLLGPWYAWVVTGC